MENMKLLKEKSKVITSEIENNTLSFKVFISFLYGFPVKAKLKSPIVQQSRNVLISNMNRLSIDPLAVG
ncbi:MAG: hypothetical protein XE06_1271, partial [Anaerolineaceae bacterium 46_22]